MGLIYNNRLVLNQRGSSITMDNGTEREKIKLSHRSGSNISITNVVNSELATNNKQTNIVHDSFDTVGGDRTEFVGKSHTFRNGENSYQLRGFLGLSELENYQAWKDTYEPVAKINSQFKTFRGGIGYPNGSDTKLLGERADNPVINSKTVTVENKFNGYSGVPIRRSNQDDVSSFSKVPDKGKTEPAAIREITKEDIELSAGAKGSKAPGVLEFGADKSAATEGGTWVDNISAQKIDEIMLEVQSLLIPIEKKMGHGGDDTVFLKRNLVGQIGTVFNDYPSIRIDPKGRSQPLEMLVSTTGAYKNHDYIPHVEEVDNSSNFPGGNDDKVICNRYSRTVGSGGIHLKTTGSMEIGGSTLKAGFTKININASHGIQIASESAVEIQSLKTVTLRSNRQVYVESGLGVRGDVVVGGGAYIEGELYCHHITAPLEVHQTEDTISFGKFATDKDRTLLMGECLIGGNFYPVYAKASDDLIVNYPHSHHVNGPAMRLTRSNEDLRKMAQSDQINNHSNISQALAQNHEKKRPQEG